MPPIQHIHPMLVHFPIVFMMCLAAFDLFASLRGANIAGRGFSGNLSTGLAVLAGIFAVSTFYFGGLALDVAESGGFHSDIAETHESLGEMTAIAFGIWATIRLAIWSRDINLPPLLKTAVPLVEIAGAILVTATAYYGGQLVYDLGVNVAHAAG